MEDSNKQDATSTLNGANADSNEDAPQDETPTEMPDATTTDNTHADVEEPQLDVVLLREMVDKLRAESQTNLDGWQRSRAEFNNYRRRTQQQLSESKQKGAIDALAKVLPILDDFERAFANIPSDIEDNPWVSGTSLILKNLQKVMDEFDIETLDPVGEEFNPNFHEAIGMDDDSDYESGIVTTTLQKGYKSGDHVLRPALVRVAS